MTNNYILAISGNDIFSGGGLYADLATYTTNKLHGFLAVTCLTALTEKVLTFLQPMKPSFLTSSIA